MIAYQAYPEKIPADKTTEAYDMLSAQSSTSSDGAYLWQPTQKEQNSSLTQGAPTIVRSCSAFDVEVQGEEDQIAAVLRAFQEDQSEFKLGLGVGAYRDHFGLPYYLAVVRDAEKRIISDSQENKEYPGLQGFRTFCDANDRIVFGESSQAAKDGRIATVQCVSGSGALRVGAEFLRRNTSAKCAYLPNQTWSNHPLLFEEAGLELREFRYYDQCTKGLDWVGMMQDLSSAAAGSVVVLQTVAHNPTGVDLNKSQWMQLAQLALTNGLMFLLDNAYQGFGSGDLEADAFPIRLLESAGLEFVVANSFSKNLGLYSERAGAVSVMCHDSQVARQAIRQLTQITRPMYSMPPKHGAAIVVRILNDEQLFAKWKQELRGMYERIIHVRQALRAELQRLNTPGNWSFITEQVGMFSLLGVSKKQVQYLRSKWHVYLCLDSRTSMAGLAQQQVKSFALSLHDTIVNCPP